MTGTTTGRPPLAQFIRSRSFIYCLLAIFIVALTLHGSLSRVNLDRHADLVENYAWGALWQWGYFKHPPFFAWMTAAWFSVLPHTQWAYFLLASVNAAAALLAVYWIGLRLRGADYGLLAVCLAIVMPPFWSLALNYNANAAMTPIWAFLVLFYLRGLEKGKLADAAMIGLLAAAAMLAKYMSAVILLTLFLHALTDRSARALLWSTFGLVAVAFFAIGFAPHLVWLVNHEFLPIVYASHQGDGELGPMLARSLLFLVTPLAYSALSFGLLLLLRQRGDGVGLLPLDGVKALWTTQPGRVLLAVTLLPVLLTIVLGILAGAEIDGVWAIPFYSFFALFWAAILPARLIAAGLQRVVTGVLVFLLVIVAIAVPWRHLFEEKIEKSHYLVPMEQLAPQVDAALTKAGLGSKTIIFGDIILSNSMSFYANHALVVVQNNSRDFSKSYITDQTIRDLGMVGICMQRDAKCEGVVSSMMAPGAQTVAIAVARPDLNKSWTVNLFLQLPAAAAQ